MNQFASFCVAIAPLMACAVQAGEAPVQQGSTNDGGVRMRWQYSPARDAGGSGLGQLDIQISDMLSGQPVVYSSGRLAAWLQRRRATLSDGELECSDKVRMFASQGIGRRADIDLNAYRIVTLNSDHTIAFINPFVRLNNAKLESIIELPSRPKTWLMLPDQLQAWVLLSEPSALVAVDLHSRRIVRRVELPLRSGAVDGVRVGRDSLAFDPASKQLWVSARDGRDLFMVDLSSADASPRLVELNAPLTLLADSQQPGAGVLAAQADGAVIAYSTSLIARRWRVQGQPVAAAYSKLSNNWVLATKDGSIYARSADAPDSSGQSFSAPVLKLSHPLQTIAVFDDGRRLLAVGNGQASAVDLGTNQVFAQSAVQPAAQQILFTSNFAYVVSPAHGKATLLPLKDLQAGRVQPIDVLLGRAESGGGQAAVEHLAPSAAVLPSGSGVLAASGADGAVFQYGEGMMAPIGSFSNYRRAAIGLAVLDLSPREVAPGHYRTFVRHQVGGTYDIVTSGVGPRFAGCGSMVLAPVPNESTAAAVGAKVQLSEVVASGAGEQRQNTVRVRWSADQSPGQAQPNPKDLTLLVFDRAQGWQQRARLQSVGDDLYEAHVRVPMTGRYELLATSVSANLSFMQGRLGSVDLEGTQ